MLLIFDVSQWISVVTAGVTVLALAGFWKLISGKADKALVDKAFEVLRVDSNKDAGESLRQYRELRTAIEVLQKEVTLLDKHSLTNTDLIDMRSDIKELIKGQAEALKLIDSMPDRVTSLEATRNKQSER